MFAVETIWCRGEGKVVWEVPHPKSPNNQSEHVAEQLRSGALKQVANKDGGTLDLEDTWLHSDDETAASRDDEVADSVEDVPAEMSDPPDGTVDEILQWVHGDPTKALLALEAETERDEPRKTLVAELDDLAGD